jgi:hypothetical protein
MSRRLALAQFVAAAGTPLKHRRLFFLPGPATGPREQSGPPLP